MEKEENRAIIMDRILGESFLNPIRSRDIYEQLARWYRGTDVHVEYAELLHLCKLLERKRLVTLKPDIEGKIKHHAIEEYVVAITNDGIFLSQTEGSFHSQYLAKRKWRSREVLKTWALVANSTAILILTFAPLAYQIWRDNNERKKVVKLELSADDVIKLKALLVAPPKVKPHRDSAVVTTKKLPKR